MASKAKDDWNTLDDDDEEVVEQAIYETAKETILFCIDASQSMQEVKSGVGYSNLHMSLKCAMDLQKRKVLFSPSDSVGILLFNTEETLGGGDIKPHHQLIQEIRQINADQIHDLVRMIAESENDQDYMKNRFAPYERGLTVGEVLTCCIAVFRTFAPKTSVKRVFLITDNDKPMHSPHDITVAAQKYTDLTDTGGDVVPFFLSDSEKPFDMDAFYAEAFASLYEAGKLESVPDPISGFDDLMEEMRIRESMKRALFTVPLHLGEGLSIGVKGYALVVEQKRSAYKKFANMGQTLEEVTSKTTYVDTEQQTEADKSQIVFGFGNAAPREYHNEDAPIPTRPKTFFTQDEVKAFRTLGIEPGIQILGFKDKDTLYFQDNVKHAYFLYPNEAAYTGSTRTFNALLKSTLKKQKIIIARFMPRKGSPPCIAALVPQEESVTEGGQQTPPGFHVITFPFADEIRFPPPQAQKTASNEQVEVASRIVEKLTFKKPYDPDIYLSPALALHYGMLQAIAFNDSYEMERDFSDSTTPDYDMIHKRVGALMAKWKDTIDTDPSANAPVEMTQGVKRKAEVNVDEAHMRDAWIDGRLNKFKVEELKGFLKGKGQAAVGKKADLIAKVEEWFAAH